MEMVSVKGMPVEKKLEAVLEPTIKLLPQDLGEQLQALLTPGALTAIAATLVVWAGAHLFGVGEIADLVLLIVGYVALDGVALEAAKHIADFIKLTINANTDKDLDDAAKHLAQAISLIGVQSVMVILFRKKPGDTFKTIHGVQMPPHRQAFPRALPRTGGVRYQPKLVFTRRKDTGWGATNLFGDIRIGRFPGKGGRKEMLAAIFHERVHQFLSPKFYLLREIRIYAKQSGYQRSFILRYIEEALAETIARLRAYGWTKQNVFEGLVFPLNGNYTLTIANLGMEAKGLLFGPVMAGGMMFNVYYGISTDQP